MRVSIAPLEEQPVRKRGLQEAGEHKPHDQPGRQPRHDRHERASFAARIAAAGIADACWQAREDIDGGVRIRAGSNVVDATIDGLLADRAGLEGGLLDLLQEGSSVDAPPGSGSSTPATTEGNRR